MSHLSASAIIGAVLLSSPLTAHAACPDLDALVGSARDSFADAEVAEARTTLGQAYAALGCQQVTVPRGSLLALYHLDALASIADEDSKAALFAVIRAVALDPDVPPPAEFGPELRAQHDTWAGRLREDLVRVVVVDEDVTVWIDGLAVDGDVDVVTGEHLVQVRSEGWDSRVMDLSVAGKSKGLPLRLEAPPVVAPEPDPLRPPDIPPPPEPRRISPGVVATGVVLAAGGAGAIVGGRVLENRFDADPYNDQRYGDCNRTDACWPDARADKIGADARRANALYMTGYVVAGLGVGVLGLEVFVLQNGQSRGIGLRGRL